MVRDHVPQEGVNPRALAEARPTKPNTTVYRNENHAIQDLRDALNSKISELDQLSPGGEPLKVQHTLREPRQGYHAEYGHPAVEVTFRSVTVVMVRLDNDKLHLLHFSPSYTRVQ